MPINTNTNLNLRATDVAVDAKGNAFAVWSQLDTDGTQRIWVNYYNVSTGMWDVPAPLEKETGSAFNPHVAFDAKGNAMAVWSQYGGLYDSIYAKRYVAGTGWGAALPLDSVQFDASEPQLAMDFAGNAFVVWVQRDGAAADSPYSIWANRFDAAGSAWGGAKRLESSSSNSFSPKVATDASGTAVVVWYDVTGSAPNRVSNIWTNRFNGTTWGAADLVEKQAGNASEPSIAMDGKGNAQATWTQSDGARYNIWAKPYSNANQAWGEPVQVSKQTDGHAYTPQAAFDPAGNAIAVWWQVTGFPSKRTEHASHYSVSTAVWGVAATLGESVGGVYDGPQIAIDTSGNAIVAWRNWDGANHNVLYNRYSAGTWGGAQPLETDSSTNSGAELVRLAMNPGGVAVAVWAYYSPTAERIFANVYR